MASPACLHLILPHAVSQSREGELDFTFLHMKKCKFKLPQRLLLSAQVDWEARFTIPPENDLKEQKYGAMIPTVDTKEQTAELGHGKL